MDYVRPLVEIGILDPVQKGISVNIVVGSDRQKEFENLANKYNGQLYNFDQINVISAGERDPDAEGVEGMSASKLRKLVADGDAEGFAAGEMKHGPIALIEDDVPVIMFLISDGNGNEDKAISNLHEAYSRGAKIILIADKNCIEKATFAHLKIEIPNFETNFKSLFSPFLMAIPAQLLAYHVANERGTDVDQPRNLAKSVTVE